MIDDFVDVDGISIHYHQYPYDGETIIFLHFGFSSLAMWNGVVPFFEGKYRLILPDYRGHGLSDKPKSDYHIDEMADDPLKWDNWAKLFGLYLLPLWLAVPVLTYVLTYKHLPPKFQIFKKRAK